MKDGADHHAVGPLPVPSFTRRRQLRHWVLQRALGVKVRRAARQPEINLPAGLLAGGPVELTPAGHLPADVARAVAAAADQGSARGSYVPPQDRGRRPAGPEADREADAGLGREACPVAAEAAAGLDREAGSFAAEVPDPAVASALPVRGRPQQARRDGLRRQPVAEESAHRQRGQHRRRAPRALRLGEAAEPVARVARLHAV
ncbi:unnamed protein product [Prorocentrum cordatum]|uniref:Uncharacterized protein n=1 Tax=Prorocentrum cordatum TaxID=2364126 RepID=A0ABN9SBW1_9DINO|nr:unnamed protein product [Polarella glacialis]